MSLPSNVIAASRRRSQMAQLLRHFQTNDCTNDVSKVRIEVSMNVAGLLSRAVEVARQVGRDVMSCLECRTISYVDFVTELERMVDLAGYLGLGVGRCRTSLSALHVQFSAHFLNSVGVCTERVRDKLVRADGGGHFPWEPTVQAMDQGVVGDDFVAVLTVAAPAAVPAHVALPTVSVPVTIGVGAGQRQVLTVPTAETELQFIRAHVSVSRAPRGKFAVRRRNGSILRAHADVEWLYRYVLQNVGDWRNTLSVC